MANGNSFVGNLSRHIGQTVTIFTTSGGQSGDGFTGVLVSVNPSFVRLITQIGSAPGCALGNCCDDRKKYVGDINTGCYGEDNFDNPLQSQNEFENGNDLLMGNFRESLGGQGRAVCNRFTLGAVVDIPVDRIASFVHNAIGSGW